ncbi:MAG: hypothetical protein BJ554DRAFT_456 [Olpidium bornovanus]|uniref:Uncharacterized protein n=1 Tax=Olpidium bornovanus TaxID=278681 RepID=A0A8H8DLZ4_9FUNG|nr:MAG: hypothetical protein BJ554DRAFT_456 [Olpidium bornovanus]
MTLPRPPLLLERIEACRVAARAQASRATILACDFDETLTAQDSLALLALLAHGKTMSPRDAGGGGCRCGKTLTGPAEINACPRWSSLVDAYLADLGAHRSAWRVGAEERARRRPPTQGPAAVAEYLAHLDAENALDAASLQRVRESRCLAGLTREEIFALGAKVPLRPAAARTLRRFLAAAKGDDGRHRRELHVVSVNWSRDLILGTLTAAVEPQADEAWVASSDLEFVDGISTGAVRAQLLVGGDKRERFMEIGRRAADAGYHPVRTIYVGDSVNDLACLCEFCPGLLSTYITKRFDTFSWELCAVPVVVADVGIIMGCNATLDEACKELGVAVLGVKNALEIPRPSDGGQVLYRANGWEELDDSGVLLT